MSFFPVLDGIPGRTYTQGDTRNDSPSTRRRTSMSILGSAQSAATQATSTLTGGVLSSFGAAQSFGKTPFSGFGSLLLRLFLWQMRLWLTLVFRTPVIGDMMAATAMLLSKGIVFCAWAWAFAGFVLQAVGTFCLDISETLIKLAFFLVDMVHTAHAPTNWSPFPSANDKSIPQLVPRFDLPHTPIPQIPLSLPSLPTLTLPEISLEKPSLPQVPLPKIPLPQLPIPQAPLPAIVPPVPALGLPSPSLPLPSVPLPKFDLPRRPSTPNAILAGALDVVTTKLSSDPGSLTSTDVQVIAEAETLATGRVPKLNGPTAFLQGLREKEAELESMADRIASKLGVAKTEEVVQVVGEFPEPEEVVVGEELPEPVVSPPLEAFLDESTDADTLALPPQEVQVPVEASLPTIEPTGLTPSSTGTTQALSLQDAAGSAIPQSQTPPQSQPPEPERKKPGLPMLSLPEPPKLSFPKVDLQKGIFKTGF